MVTDKGKAADQERVWNRYIELCKVQGNSITGSNDKIGGSESDLQEVTYEDGVDDFAGLVVML